MLALGAAVLFWLKKRRRPQDAPYQADTTAEMEDQDHTLAKRKWFLGGSWRNEAEAKRDPLELDSKTVRLVAGPPVELDSYEVQHARVEDASDSVRRD